MSRLLLLLLMLLAAALSSPAQTITAGRDTTRINGPAPTKKQLSAADSAARTERLFGFRVTRPTKAALLAFAPGGGQIYNKKYWKLPLVYGLLGGLAYGEYFYQKIFLEYVVAENKLGATVPVPIGDPDLGKHASRERSPAGIRTRLNAYRGSRDVFILYLAGGYGLQILDALVDAHLHDFDVSDDLTLHWDPALLPVPGQPLPAFGATVALRYK